jgi:hypothetical protein
LIYFAGSFSSHKKKEAMLFSSQYEPRKESRLLKRMAMAELSTKAWAKKGIGG